MFYESIPVLFQMENHLQYSACSAKSPLKSEMVQSVPGTTYSNGRCVEPWEFKEFLHTLRAIDLV